MEVGKRINALRKKKGMTQKELAGLLCVTDKAISRWESGVGNPDLNTLPKIAEIFNVSIDYLLSDNREMVEGNVGSNTSTDFERVSKPKSFFRKKVIIIALSVVTFAEIAVGVTFGTLTALRDSKNKEAYGLGINYLETGEYEGAKQIFDSLNYKDSDDKSLVCNGMIEIQNAKTTGKQNKIVSGISFIIEGNSVINAYYEGNDHFIVDDKTRYETVLSKNNRNLLIPDFSDFGKWNVQSYYYYQNAAFLYLSALWK